MRFNVPNEMLVFLLDRIENTFYNMAGTYSWGCLGACIAGFREHSMQLVRTLLYYRSGYRYLDAWLDLEGDRVRFWQDTDVQSQAVWDKRIQSYVLFGRPPTWDLFWSKERDLEIQRGVWFCRNRVFVDGILALSCAMLPRHGEFGEPPVRSLIRVDGDHWCMSRVFAMLVRPWEEVFAAYDSPSLVRIWQEDERLWTEEKEERKRRTEIRGC